MFKVGDKIIHNFYGLCEIAAIEMQDTYYGKQECYIIYMDKTKIMIPVSHSEMLRYPIGKEEIPGVLDRLSNTNNLPEELPSEERIRLFLEKFKTNDIVKISEILRDIVFLGETDKLKTQEKNLRERINKLLSDELSFVQNITKAEVLKTIDNCLRKVKESAKCRRK
ncbi:MAG: CarD family transcriptional regulator [Candidatus Omnitrophota bacterium]|nr:CarD family transcriptional regulator [Candidatus Omnitrophota bacterium]